MGKIAPVLSGDDIIEIQKLVTRVPVSDQVLGYAWALVRASRPGTPEAPDFINKWVSWGAGPRGVLTLVSAAKARAILYGRYHATVADVQAVAKPALRHRLASNYAAQASSVGSEKLIEMLMEAVPADKKYESRRLDNPRAGDVSPLICTDESAARQMCQAPRSIDGSRTGELVALTVLSRYLNPEVLGRMAERHIEPRGLVIGNLAGAHKSPLSGFAVEFAGHREYVPGDDPKHIDWRVYFTRDKYFIKQYEMETNFVCHLILDVSASMRYGDERQQKMLYAAQMATTLGYSIVRQSDKVSLATFDEKVWAWCRRATRWARSCG